MKCSERIVAVLLAAGRSRRMGAFKPLLPFGGRTVVEACVVNLREGGVDDVVVVVGHRADEVRAQLRHLPVKFALNPEPESEMGASIGYGLRALAEGWDAVLVALGDQPAVPPEVIRLLLDARARTGARLIIPAYGDRGGHPVLLDASLRAELSRLDPERGLRALFEAHRGEVLRLPAPSPLIARDIDTWDDYRALHEEVFGVPPPLNND